MDSRIDTDLVLAALLMAIWRRKPKALVTLHSDQGYQFTSHEWQDFLKSHNLVASMSHRGNCHDNVVAESFFQLLKRERIRRQIYLTRDLARSDVFHYIEMFYNPRVSREAGAIQTAMTKNASIRQRDTFIAMTIGVSLNTSAHMAEAQTPPPPTCEVMPWSERESVQAPTMLTQPKFV